MQNIVNFLVFLAQRNKKSKVLFKLVFLQYLSQGSKFRLDEDCFSRCSLMYKAGTECP